MKYQTKRVASTQPSKHFLSSFLLTPREELPCSVAGGAGAEGGCGLPGVQAGGGRPAEPAHSPGPAGPLQREGHPAVDGRAPGRPGLLQHLHRAAPHSAVADTR